MNKLLPNDPAAKSCFEQLEVRKVQKQQKEQKLYKSFLRNMKSDETVKTEQNIKINENKPNSTNSTENLDLNAKDVKTDPKLADEHLNIIKNIKTVEPTIKSEIPTEEASKTNTGDSGHK